MLGLQRSEGLPVAGLEWCDQFAREIENRLDEVQCLEIVPENFMALFGFSIPHDFFRAIEKRQIPVMVHSVGLSVGSIEPLKMDYFDQVMEVFDQLPTAISLSDHLCMTEKDGNEIGQLTSIPYNRPTLAAVKEKIEMIQDRIQVPFALENITHCFLIPNQEFTETEFFNELFAATGVKLLLDLNNLYTNGVNFGIDPYRWLSEIQPGNIDSIHLAGGYVDTDNMLMDGHCSKVPDEVWELYRHSIASARRGVPTIVENTEDIAVQGLEFVLEDVRKAQGIMDEFLLGCSREVLPATQSLAVEPDA